MGRGSAEVDALVNLGFVGISVLLMATTLPAMANDIGTALDKESVDNQAKAVAGLLSIAYNAPGSIKLTHEFPLEKSYTVTVKADGYVEVCAGGDCATSRSLIQLEKEFTEKDVEKLVIMKIIKGGKFKIELSTFVPEVALDCGSCTLPIGDTSILPLESARQKFCVERPRSSACDITTWNRVVSKAQSIGMNPAFVVSIWGEESGFSDNAISYKAALGCLDGTKEIDEQLVCIEKLYKSDNYLSCGSTEFCSFMLWYSGGSACTLSNNPNFFKNFRMIYQDFVPSGAGALAC